MLPRTKISELDEVYEELNFIICGNVDAGKSSFLGVLSNPLLRNDLDEIKNCLDDGDGLSRKHILKLPHEKESGRTSSISYIPILFKKELWNLKNSLIITISDLCGHQKYLKTTIKGIMQPTNDYAIVCIENKISNTTLEHIGLLQIMKIPFCVVFTKCDLQIKDKLAKLFSTVNKLFTPYNKRLFPITEKNIDSINLAKQIPAFFVSSKTGENILLFMRYLSTIPKNEFFQDYISVDNIFTVEGIGKVITGYTGIEVNIQDKFLLGPLYDGSFVEVQIRSIHDNYYNPLKSIKKNKFGGFALKVPKNIRIHKGSILTKSAVKVYTEIKAKIKVILSTVSINSGYNTVFCMGSSSLSATFTFDKETIIRQDKSWHEISIKFSRPIYLGDTKFVFRDKNIVGYGTIIF